MTKQSLRFFAAISICSLGLLAQPTIGSAGTTHTIEQKGKAKGHDKDKDKDKDKGTRVVVVDRHGHQRIVREYVTRGNLPPGLAKRRALPPGLAKQLRETGELPPGLQPYFTPVPQEIDVRFPVLPAYYHRYFAGNDFVVVDTRTNRIVLLIRDLLQ
ncbi:MAG: hypothetical protein Q7R30_18125 [Acidobacteriota bacterium]|nr:hypothetical protein [Acidobacteriota bacterium]